MNEWMNNPMLKKMDPAKLELIRMAASQTNGKTGKDLAPVLLSLITNANKKGIRFTSEEINLILDILKQGKTQEEQAQMDKMISMIKAMILKHGK